MTERSLGARVNGRGVRIKRLPSTYYTPDAALCAKMQGHPAESHFLIKREHRGLRILKSMTTNRFITETHGEKAAGKLKNIIREHNGGLV